MSARAPCRGRCLPLRKSRCGGRPARCRACASKTSGSPPSVRGSPRPSITTPTVRRATRSPRRCSLTRRASRAPQASAASKASPAKRRRRLCLRGAEAYPISSGRRLPSYLPCSRFLMTPIRFDTKKRSLPAGRRGIDWTAFCAALSLALLGLLTMSSFQAQDPFFLRQALWILIGVGAFFIAAQVDWRFLLRSTFAAGFYAVLLLPLVFLIVAGHSILGAKSWFDLGFFAFQPAEFVKLALIVALAKYFSRRHIEIKNIRHILVSGTYAAVVFVLVALQPDFGSAIIIFLIWLGIVLLSGLSRVHLFSVLGLGLLAFGGLWLFGFHDYQKQRIMTFLNPLQDIHGAGYNAYQSTIAVGSGELFGKGIGDGTQSKLRFLPEYQTDFIFAAYAEEWGFVGVAILFGLFGILILRMLVIASHGSDNFDTLFGAGIAVYFTAQFIVHVGMNIGLLPITGTTLPFMSYGGSHLVTEYLALGILMGMRRHAKPSIQARDETEIVGAL